MKSKAVHFISSEPAAGPALMDGIGLLNQLGQALQRYKQGHGLNDFELRRHLPVSDVFQDLVADWWMSRYLNISALQVMGNLNRRSNSMPKNYFYSILGVFTQQPSLLEQDSTEAELSESLMNLCEQKNDYSLLYSTTPRDGRPGKRCRPKPDFLHPVLSWRIIVSAQEGHYSPEGFWLDSMVKLNLSDKADFATKEHIIKGLQLSTPVSSSNHVVALN